MITLLNYGCGNVGSILNMIRHVGGQAEVTGDPVAVLSAKKILLPGVGSFDNAMRRLAETGLIEPLKMRAQEGIPILGICLGMQLLANDSEEGCMAGLGLIQGRVRRFYFDGESAKLKIPHMGWNYVTPIQTHPLAEGIEGGARFYFVHSYYFDCENDEDVLLKSNYGHEFTSGVRHGNVMGIQFHPEKSHRHGMQLMQNFVKF